MSSESPCHEQSNDLCILKEFLLGVLKMALDLSGVRGLLLLCRVPLV